MCPSAHFGIVSIFRMSGEFELGVVRVSGEKQSIISDSWIHRCTHIAIMLVIEQ